MNTCWKCGRQVPDGERECEYGCVKSLTQEETDKFAKCLARFANRRKLDWSKVKTTEDLILILGTLFGDATVDPESVEAAKLERFLEPKKENPS